MALFVAARLRWHAVLRPRRALGASPVRSSTNLLPPTCPQALLLDTHYAKARYRRAHAYAGQHMWREAVLDMEVSWGCGARLGGRPLPATACGLGILTLLLCSATPGSPRACRGCSNVCLCRPVLQIAEELLRTEGQAPDPAMQQYLAEWRRKQAEAEAQGGPLAF